MRPRRWTPTTLATPARPALSGPDPRPLPGKRSLADVVGRMLPFWYDFIVPSLRAGRRVLVSAHGNSLRALVKHLDGISDDEIPLNIPTGIPLVYELDDDLNQVKHYYLGDEAEIKKAMEAVAAQGKAGK